MASPKAPPTARLYCLIARGARKAVVFRRGPNKQVRLLSWDLRSDRIEGGQWLKGRIYERRCDLNVDGSLLVYFAAKFRGPVASWTAVSRPPLLTAVAFFPKGDCWGGGGLFDTDGSLALNHRPDEPEDARLSGALKSGRKAKRVPRYLREGSSRPWDVPALEDKGPVVGQTAARNALKLPIRKLGEHSGSGEDSPILPMRLERDGWTYLKAETQTRQHGDKSGSRIWLTFDPPVRRFKPIAGTDLRLQVSWHGLKERDNRWYVETMEIVGPRLNERSFGRIDWADADHNGDVLYAAEGKLFRARITRIADIIEADCRMVADLNDMKFEELAPQALGPAVQRARRNITSPKPLPSKLETP
jgi:hypothetical protein